MTSLDNSSLITKGSKSLYGLGVVRVEERLADADRRLLEKRREFQVKFIKSNLMISDTGLWMYSFKLNGHSESICCKLFAQEICVFW